MLLISSDVKIVFEIWTLCTRSGSVPYFNLKMSYFKASPLKSTLKFQKQLFKSFKIGKINLVQK